jgi:hypothetical protein
MEEEYFIRRAKTLALNKINASLVLNPIGWVKYHDIDVEWTLQNRGDWRVFLSTAKLDTLYLVTFVKQTGKTYVDPYKMIDSIAVAQ